MKSSRMLGIVILMLIVSTVGFVAGNLFNKAVHECEKPNAIEFRRDFKEPDLRYVSRGINDHGEIVTAVIITEQACRWMLRQAPMAADSTLFEF